jgi:hypothetical protein
MASKKKSLLWQYFVLCDNDKAECNQCKQKIACKGGTTSGLQKHLKSMHCEQFEKFIEEKRINDEVSGEATRKRKADDVGSSAWKQPKLSFSVDVEKQKKFDDKMVEFFADTFTPFNVVGKESFKNVIKVACGGIKVKNPRTYSRMVEAKAKNVLGQVTDIMASVKKDILSIGFTSDLWTSRSGDSYISLTASYIDKDWTMQRWTPFVKPFPERHTGVNIRLELDGMIEQLAMDTADIAKYAINDNAANMKLAISESQYLIQYFCDIHTLQLGINDTFKNVPGMKTVLSRSKEIAKYTHQSPVAMNELSKQASVDNVKFKKPKNPCDTRWNAQFDSMVSILALKMPIIHLCEENDAWSSKALDRSQWKLLEGAVHVLKSLKETTKVFEAEKTPTINRVIERIYTNQMELTEFIENPENNRNEVTFARELKRNLEKRFPNLGMDLSLRRMANFLDPSFKGLHLSVKNLLDDTKTEIETEAKKFDCQDVENEETEVADNSAILSPTSKLRKQLRTATEVHHRRRRSKVRMEIEKYETFSTPGKDVDILLWWKVHEAVLPLLSKLARRVLAIPSSSAKSERVFSVGGNLVTVKRGRLAASKVEDLIVIKENLEKVNEFKKFNNIEKAGGDCTLEVKTVEIPVQVSAIFDEDEEMLEVYDHYDTDSSSDEMEIQL